jgi:hypothetical protein
MQTQMLAPAAVLVIWTLLILGWTAVTRLGGMAKLGTDLKSAPPGGRGQNLEGVLPDSVMWKSHNYAHLVEQPTLFYATSAILAITGAAQLDVRLAWAYVILRVAHSLWQTLVNTIPIRFTLFLISTGCLMALALRALLATCPALGGAA